MYGGMLNNAVKVAARAVELYGSCNEIAQYIGNEFDRMYQRCWQCFVIKGGSSGYLIRRNDNHCINFYIDDWKIVLFRTRNLS